MLNVIFSTRVLFLTSIFESLGKGVLCFLISTVIIGQPENDLEKHTLPPSSKRFSSAADIIYGLQSILSSQNNHTTLILCYEQNSLVPY